MEGPGSSGFDMSKMSTAEKLLAGGSILLLIVSFFPWQSLGGDLGDLLGRNDDHLRTLESEFEVRIVARGHDVMLKGDERQVQKAERALTQLRDRLLVQLTEHLWLDATQLERFAEKSAENLVQAIEDSKAQPLSRLIFGRPKWRDRRRQ